MEIGVKLAGKEPDTRDYPVEAKSSGYPDK